MRSFIMNSHEVFIHIHQGCFAGTGAIVRLPQCQWRKPDGYEKISQCITTTKHSKAKTVCIFLGIYCISNMHVLSKNTLHLFVWQMFSIPHDAHLNVSNMVLMAYTGGTPDKISLAMTRSNLIDCHTTWYQKLPVLICKWCWKHFACKADGLVEYNDS